MSYLVRSAAQHESAHVVVARALGLRVVSAEVRADGSGVTLCYPGAVPSRMAAVTVSGDLWQREFGTVPYRDGACSDLADFEANHGLSRLWHAQRTARALLTQHRRAVFAFARRLELERVVRLD